MNRALRYGLYVGFGLVIFWAIRHFIPTLHEWISIVSGIGVAVIAFVSDALDFTKKILEVRKLWQESAKLHREAEKDKQGEEAAKHLVQSPTKEEIEKYGESYLERKIALHVRMEAERETLRAKIFITKLEEKRGDRS